MSFPLLRDSIDSRFFASNYIKDDARSSYRHWWQQLGYLLEISYSHLNPNPHQKPWGYRWRYSKREDLRKMVEHTTIFPDGTNVTYQWLSAHSPSWRHKCNGDFRQRQAFRQHGIAPKMDVDQASADWRAYKGFQRDRIKSRHSYRGSKWGRQQLNRESRQAARQAIHHERWDELSRVDIPYDWWRFD